MAVTPPIPDTDYAALFRTYIQRSVQFALADARATGPALPVDERDQALHTLQYALATASAWEDARELLKVIAPKLEQAGYREGFIPYLQQGIAQCAANGELAHQAELEQHLGSLLMVMARMEDARRAFMDSAQHAAAAGDAHGEAAALNRWAYLDYLQQRYADAEERLTAAGRLTDAGDSEVCYTAFVRGMMAMAQRDWNAAETHLRAALAGWQRHGDPVRIARSLTNLANALRGAGQVVEALELYQQAIAQMHNLGDTANEAATRMNLGNAYNELGQPQQALVHYRLAEPVFRLTRDHLRLARVQLNMGIAQSRLAEWDQAQELLTSAVEFYRKLGDARGTANALDALAEVLLAQGQWAAALAATEQAWQELGNQRTQPGLAPLLADIEKHRAAARQGLADAG